MVRTDGKVFEEVKQRLQMRGRDTSTLQIVSFGRGSYHDIVLNGAVIGTYEHIGKKLVFHL